MIDLDPSTDPPRAARPAAFRRPGLVLAYAVYLLVAGLAVAAPWSATLRTTVSGYPRGDAELFDRGGVMLVEAVRLAGRGAPAAVASSGIAVVLTGALGLVPFAMLIAGLGRAGRVRASFLAARAARAIGTLTLLWGASFAAQAVLGALLSILGVKIIGGLHLAARGEFTAHVILGVVALLVILPLGVARDLAAVSAVNDETRFYTSASRALRVVRRAFGRAVGGYLVRALAAIALLLAAFVIPTLLGGPDAPPAVALPFAVHQVALLLAIFLRASWLASAIRLLDERAPLFRPLSSEIPLVPGEVALLHPPPPLAPAESASADSDGSLLAAESKLLSPPVPLSGTESAAAEPDGPLSATKSASVRQDEPLLAAESAPAVQEGTLSSAESASVDPDGVGEPER